MHAYPKKRQKDQKNSDRSQSRKRNRDGEREVDEVAEMCFVVENVFVIRK